MTPKSKPEKSDLSLEDLRTYYHSVHDAERKEVIQLLSAMKGPDANRELIEIYEECEWRDTRFQIIRGLAQNPDQRGLEFLFRLTQKTEDLPIAEAAIWSLGQTHQRLAALFLTHLYSHCDELLKPAVVGAIGQIPDRTLASEFLKNLPSALKEKKVILVKNLINTLGELKVKEALPILVQLILDLSKRPSDELDPQLPLCALVAIGKIGRDPKQLDSIAPCFSEDPFEYQLFTSIKTQVQIRSQWTLEDYLNRLFSSTSIHPSLPFELSHFPPEDVKSGLQIFSDPKHFENLCTALSKIDFLDISQWYLDLIPFKNLDETQTGQVLKSLACHFNTKMRDVFRAIPHDKPESLPLWLESAMMSLPDAEGEFKKILERPDFPSLPVEIQIAAINSLFHFGLTVRMIPSQLQKIGQILDTLLSDRFSPPIHGRVLRALGSLNLATKKAKEMAKDYLSNPSQFTEALLPSYLKYLENCPDKAFATQLLQGLQLSQSPSFSKNWLKWGQSFLKALNHLPHSVELSPQILEAIRIGLKGESPDSLKIELLRFCANQKITALQNEILFCLKSNERIQLAALVTLKKIGDENAAEFLAPFLHSKQQSIAGRALDTLLGLPGLRAKRIAIDFLVEKSADSEICDKIIRCLVPPENSSDYFLKAVDGILKNNPTHPLVDGFLQLRDKLIRKSKSTQPGPFGGKSNAVVAGPKKPDIEAIDRELTQKLPGYYEYDEAVKSALRSAELPYLHREMFDEYVDKGSSVVEYCKAVDLLLESNLGKKLLFPKLEASLYEFQNVIHAAGLQADYPSSDYVLKQTGLSGAFTSQNFPLHKMGLISNDIKTGRILRDYFRTMDGLRAWAIVLLLFGRKIQGLKPLLHLGGDSEDSLIRFCKRLMALQDARNPFAHRQTAVSFSFLDEIRTEVFFLLTHFPKSLT